MEPLTLMALSQLGGAGLNVAGGLIGSIFSSGDDAEAERALEDAWRQYAGLSAPELADYEAQLLNGTAFDNVREEAGLRSNEDAALARLAGLSDNGGWDAQSRARALQAQQEAGQYERSQREALLAQGGRYNGNAFAAALQAQQGGADRMAMAGAENAASAEQRALAALAQRGALAGAMQQRGLNTQMQKAGAADAVARYNAGERARAIIEQNNIRQQRFTNDVGVRDRKADIYREKADFKSGRAQRTRQRWGAAGQAVGTAGAGLGQSIGTYYSGRPAAGSGAEQYGDLAPATPMQYDPARRR